MQTHNTLLGQKQPCAVSSHSLLLDVDLKLTAVKDTELLQGSSACYTVGSPKEPAPPQTHRSCNT